MKGRDLSLGGLHETVQGVKMLDQKPRGMLGQLSNPQGPQELIGRKAPPGPDISNELGGQCLAHAFQIQEVFRFQSIKIGRILDEPCFIESFEQLSPKTIDLHGLDKMFQDTDSRPKTIFFIGAIKKIIPHLGRGPTRRAFFGKCHGGPPPLLDHRFQIRDDPPSSHHHHLGSYTKPMLSHQPHIVQGGTGDRGPRKSNRFHNADRGDHLSPGDTPLDILDPCCPRIPLKFVGNGITGMMGRHPQAPLLLDLKGLKNNTIGLKVIGLPLGQQLFVKLLHLFFLNYFHGNSGDPQSFQQGLLVALCLQIHAQDIVSEK